MVEEEQANRYMRVSRMVWHRDLINASGSTIMNLVSDFNAHVRIQEAALHKL